MNKKMCLGVLCFLLCLSSLSYAEPLVKYDKGSGVLTIGCTFDELAKYKDVKFKNHSNMYANLMIAANKKFAVGVRYKELGAERRMFKTFYGKDYSALQQGKLREGNLIFSYQMNKASLLKPMFSVYGGVKILDLTIDPTHVKGSYTVNTPAGPQTYTGEGTIAGKKGHVIAPMIGFQMVYPNKIADVWLDAHYNHYTNGIELGLSKELAKNVLLDASYYYDRYKYHEYDLSDKGFRLGMTYKFKMSDKRRF